MWNRVTGLAVTIAGMLSVAFLIRGLAGSLEMASFLAEAARAYGKPFNQANWLQHWRVSSAIYIVGSIALSLSGLAIYHRKAWSLAALGCTLIGFVLADWVSGAIGYSRYGFERIGLPVQIALISVGLVSLVLFARNRRKTTCPVAGV